MNVLSKTQNGKIYLCYKCKKIHIEYKNLNFNFSKKGFDSFADYIESLDGEYWEEQNKDTPFSKKILIPVGHQNLNILLSAVELAELKELFSYRTKLKDFIKFENIKYIIYNN